MNGLVLGSVLFAAPAPAQRERWGGPAGPPVPAGIHQQMDLVYAEYGGRAMRMDLYGPADRSGLRPGVLVIRGGGWLSTDKAWLGFVAAELAARGFMASSMEYRSSEEAKHPGAVHDVAAAIHWMRSHGSDVGIDPQRLGILGMSTGAYLALTQAVAPTGPEVQAVAALAPVSHLGLHKLRKTRWWQLRHPEQPADWDPVTAFMGSTPEQAPRQWIAASPAETVLPSGPPLLLVHGSLDPVVAMEQSFLMARRSRLAGNQAELVILPGAPHAFWLMPEYWPEWLDRVGRFFRSHMSTPAGTLVSTTRN